MRLSELLTNGNESAIPLSCHLTARASVVDGNISVTIELSEFEVDVRGAVSDSDAELITNALKRGTLPEPIVHVTY